MVEALIWFLALVGGAVAGLMAFAFLKGFRDGYVTKRSQLIEEAYKAAHVVVWRSPQILGRYFDLDIPSQIVLADGRQFEFESLAVQAQPGLYSVTDSSRDYVIIEGCLLYRQLTLNSPT